MRTKFQFIVCALLSASAVTAAHADEYGFSTYGLGSAAFGAGVTPPPGTYVTFVNGYYEGKLNSPVTLGGIVLNVGSSVQFYQGGVNALYVPEQKIWGGNFGVSVTVPVGHVGLQSTITGPLGNTIGAHTEGGGIGDVTTRAQLGWQDGNFSHLAYVQAVAPTGRYDTGFSAIIGLHRPGIDTGWAFTWTEATTKLQFNSSFGITYNFENTATDYKSGTDFHYEWAVGREVAKGLLIGVVGYDYRQLTGDSGSGARLGPLEGSVDAIGGGIQYTTIANGTVLVLNARHYEEYNVEKRWDGSMTIVSGTIRY